VKKDKSVERKHKIYYLTALVGGFSLLASTLLSLGDFITKDDIALRRADDLKTSLGQVIPPEFHDNDLLTDILICPQQELIEKELQVYRARIGNDVQAVAYETSVPGYAGPIVLLMGVDRNGAILGVRVVSHAETPGLGDKIEMSKSNWILSFNGHSLTDPMPDKWGVKKDGGIFDQFTGATITPRRTVNALRQGLEFFDKYRSQLLDEGVTAFYDPATVVQRPLHMTDLSKDALLIVGSSSDRNMLPERSLHED
jgi:electron transport complex protein RnfG